MKKGVLAIWATICMVWTSATGALCAFANEQVTEQSDRVSSMLLTMDVIQTVCLVIVITAVVIFVGFYLVKAVLKKMHVTPEEKKEEKKEEKNNEQK